MKNFNLHALGNWVAANIGVARFFKCADTAYILGMLYAKYKMLRNDECKIRISYAEAKNYFGISRRRFDKGIKNLERYGIIDVKSYTSNNLTHRWFIFTTSAPEIIKKMGETNKACTNVQGGMYVSHNEACTNVQGLVQNDKYYCAKRTILETDYVQNVQGGLVRSAQGGLVQNVQPIRKENKKNKKDSLVCLNSNTVNKAKEHSVKPVADESKKTNVLNVGEQQKIGFKLRNQTERQKNDSEKKRISHRNGATIEENAKVVLDIKKEKKCAQSENISEKQRALEAYWAKELEIAETMPPQMRSLIQAKVRLAKYFNKNPHIVKYLLQASRLKATKAKFWEIAVDWLAYNGNNVAVMSAPENYVHSKLLRWLNNQRIYNISKATETAQPRYYKKLK